MLLISSSTDPAPFRSKLSAVGGKCATAGTGLHCSGYEAYANSFPLETQVIAQPQCAARRSASPPPLRSGMRSRQASAVGVGPSRSRWSARPVYTRALGWMAACGATTSCRTWSRAARAMYVLRARITAGRVTDQCWGKQGAGEDCSARPNAGAVSCTAGECIVGA